jgi:biopolymer transport protein ExbD
LLEKGLELKLPTAAGSPDRQVVQEDIRTVEITAQGSYALNRRVLRLDQLLAVLVQDYRQNPNLVVYIRADENSRTRDVVALIDGCQRNGISRYSLRTEPPQSR